MIKSFGLLLGIASIVLGLFGLRVEMDLKSREGIHLALSLILLGIILCWLNMPEGT